jgi:[NiFe] hydrogenase assembly HybE family chaperone
MTEPTRQQADLPSPASALERTFRRVLHRHMRDMPMLNSALAVEAVGFRPWREHWLGMLITPWFMNLVLLPRVDSQWQAIGERETRHYVFPAGVFEFIGARDAELGDFQACSLFSPMFEFADQASARATAAAALDALFDPVSRAASESRSVLPAAADSAPNPLPVPPAPALNKRDFLLGRQPRAERGL